MARCFHPPDRRASLRPPRQRLSDDQAGNLAALIAYYGFMSIFPLLLVLVTVLGIVLADNTHLQQDVLNSALTKFPVIGAQLRSNIHSLGRSGLSIVTTGLSGISTWSGHTAFGAWARIGLVAASLVVNIALFWLGLRVATAARVATRDLRTGAVLAANRLPMHASARRSRPTRRSPNSRPSAPSDKISAGFFAMPEFARITIALPALLNAWAQVRRGRSALPTPKAAGKHFSLPLTLPSSKPDDGL